VSIQKLIKLLNILRDPAFFRALLKGTAAGTEHRRFLQNLDCRHVVDIGANRGQFALIARRCFPDAMIDSFEPLEEPAQRYQVVFDGDSLVRLHQCAIGPKDEDTTIHVSKRDDSSSLLPILSAQSTLFPNTEEKETRTIHVSPLDAVLEKDEILSPALLKLDVQGFELQVLYGCVKLFTSFAYIYVECSFIELYEGQSLAHEVIDFLHQHNFHLNCIYNMCYDRQGRAIQADFFFVKNR
jgi:FkbM family methyltransferase